MRFTEILVLQIAKGCFDVVMPYLLDRKQFGTKLADFQVSESSITLYTCSR